MNANPSALLLSCLLCSLAAAGCEEKKPQTGPVSSSTPVVPDETAENEDPPAGPRPLTIDHELTEARRGRIETKIPDARGFLFLPELEHEFQQDKTIDREAAAVEKFEERAKGKWVLFLGKMIEQDGEGYSMPVTYLPGSKRDRMKVTPSWFLVRITDIRGYSTVLTKDGMETAVLAKYVGDKAASPAHDLVGRGLW